MNRRHLLPLLLALAAAPPARAASAAPPPAPAVAGLDQAAAARFAALALACVHQEYPNKPAPVFSADAEVRPPRQLTPAFYGCFDWHSSVHGHWLLARLARLFPAAPFAAAGPGRPGAEPDARAPGRRGHLPRHARPRLLRAPLRPGLAAGPGRRAARLGRSLRPRPRRPRWRRWRAGPRRGWRAGSPSCATRSGSASTPRPPSRSGWSATGRWWPGTPPCGRWWTSGPAPTTSPIGPAPSATSPPARTSSPPASARRT